MDSRLCESCFHALFEIFLKKFVCTSIKTIIMNHFYLKRSKSRDPSPSAGRSRTKKQEPVITLSSQNRSREPSPLAQKLSQLTAEFDSLQKLVAKSREPSVEPRPFLSRDSPEKYYSNTSRKSSVSSTSAATALPVTSTLSTNHKEDIKNSIYNRLSTSRSSRESSPLEQIKSRFSHQYTTKPSAAGLSGSNNDVSSSLSYSKDSSSALLPSRISFRRSPEKVRSPPMSTTTTTTYKNNTNNPIVKRQQNEDMRTSEIDKDENVVKNDCDNDDGDDNEDDDSTSSTSCSTSTKTPSSTSESVSKTYQSKSTTAPKKSPSPPKTKIFIQVRTITRSTSPNQNKSGALSSASSSSSLTRLRRVGEIAKTVEKVRQRPLIGPQMDDKATQSDRLDDSARTSRFATSSSSSSVYSSYSMRNSPASGRYSSKFSREIELSEAKERNSSIDSLSIPSSNNRATSISSRSSISVEKSRSATPQTYQSDSNNGSVTKCENKDYRKSTLNMGPTNRSIRSTSSSSIDNPSSSVKETRKQLQQMWSNQDEFVRDKSRSGESENSEIECNLEVKKISDRAATLTDDGGACVTQPSPSREEKINQKIEEAKEFLIKTLGTAQYKSPSSAALNSSSTSSIVSNNNKKEGEADINGNYEIINEEVVNLQASTAPNINNNHNQLVNEVNTNSISSKWAWTEDGNQLNDCLKKIQRVDSGEKPWWASSNASSDNDEDDDKVDEDTTIAADVNNELKASDDEITYSDVDKHENSIECRRMSPEGVEASMSPPPPHKIESNSKAVDNIHMMMNNFPNIEHNQFISKHRNIDDLLGKMRVRVAVRCRTHKLNL